MNNYRNLYDCLLESDELYVMFDGMSGDWGKDSKKFIQAQKDLEEFANLKDVYDDDFEE